MGNPVRKLAEVQEAAWTGASGKIVIGVVVLAVGVFLIYVSKYLFTEPALQIARITGGIVTFAGTGIILAAVYTGIAARQRRGFGFPCPYCDRVVQFEGEPNDTFDCDYCNRTVHFDGGVPVPVRTVNCPFCHTEHRVATNVQRYVCDRCNRPLELSVEPRGRAGAPASRDSDAPAGVYDVLMVSADRRHETEIALKLQNLLVVNLPEARRLMANATTAAPLIVGHALPQRKAEAIRRQLQDLGATATLRPANERTPS